MTRPVSAGHYPRQALRLARLYGLTPAQLGALPLEVYELLSSLPEPQPGPPRLRTRMWDWFTRPSASLADLAIVSAVIAAANTVYVELHLPWWATFLVVVAAWTVAISAAGFIRTRLRLRARP